MIYCVQVSNNNLKSCSFLLLKRILKVNVCIYKILLLLMLIFFLIHFNLRCVRLTFDPERNFLSERIGSFRKLDRIFLLFTAKVMKIREK